jgi:acetyl-CoA synthetase
MFREGGYLITGRADDAMTVSGRNIGTAEVQSACLMHPIVSEATAFSMPSHRRGSAIHVFISLVATSHLDLKNLNWENSLSLEIKSLVMWKAKSHVD